MELYTIIVFECVRVFVYALCFCVHVYGSVMKENASKSHSIKYFSVYKFINCIVLTICYQTEITISSVYYLRILKGSKDKKKKNAILHSRSWYWQGTTERSIYVFFASCKVYPNSIEKALVFIQS